MNLKNAMMAIALLLMDEVFLVQLLMVIFVLVAQELLQAPALFVLILYLPMRIKMLEK